MNLTYTPIHGSTPIPVILNNGNEYIIAYSNKSLAATLASLDELLEANDTIGGPTPLSMSNMLVTISTKNNINNEDINDLFRIIVRLDDTNKIFYDNNNSTSNTFKMPFNTKFRIFVTPKEEVDCDVYVLNSKKLRLKDLSNCDNYLFGYWDLFPDNLFKLDLNYNSHFRICWSTGTYVCPTSNLTVHINASDNSSHFSYDLKSKAINAVTHYVKASGNTYNFFNNQAENQQGIFLPLLTYKDEDNNLYWSFDSITMLMRNSLVENRTNRDFMHTTRFDKNLACTKEDWDAWINILFDRLDNLNGTIVDLTLNYGNPPFYTNGRSKHYVTVMLPNPNMLVEDWNGNDAITIGGKSYRNLNLTGKGTYIGNRLLEKFQNYIKGNKPWGISDILTKYSINISINDINSSPISLFTYLNPGEGNFFTPYEKDKGIITSLTTDLQSEVNKERQKLCNNIFLPDISIPNGINWEEHHTNRERIIRWYIDTIINKFAEKQYSNLELLGFYWFEEDVHFQDTNNVNFKSPLSNRKYLNGSLLMEYAKNYIKTKSENLEFTWSPYLTAPKGQNPQDTIDIFDHVLLQSHYTISESDPDSNVDKALTFAKTYKTGLCLELCIYGSLSTYATTLAERLRYLIERIKAYNIDITRLTTSIYEGSWLFHLLYYDKQYGNLENKFDNDYREAVDDFMEYLGIVSDENLIS